MDSQIIIPKAGSFKVFKHQKLQAGLVIPDDSVRIKVAYSGINFADIFMRLGLYQDAPPFPFVPGYEISGVVTDVGCKVINLKVGDKVMAGTRFNGYSSSLILPDAQVASIGSLSLEEAAALPVSFLTAYIVFFEQGRVRNSDKVLIDCASGSLGQMSFQLLKKLDLDIVGLTSSEEKKVDIEKNGARAMTHEEFKKSNEGGFDLILNSLGGGSIKEHYKRLTPNGKIICIGASSLFKNGRRSWPKVIKGVLQMSSFKPINLMNDCKGVTGLNVLRLFENPEYLINILKKHDDFDLKPSVDKIFESNQVGEAHHYLESKKAKGKVLLKW